MNTPKTKPLRLGGQGLRVQRLESFCNAPIIGDSRAKSQDLPPKNTNFTKLVGHIHKRQLTESLEVLEKQGFTGDLAVFFIAIAQEVVA